jgi:PKD domain
LIVVLAGVAAPAALIAPGAATAAVPTLRPLALLAGGPVFRSDASSPSAASTPAQAEVSVGPITTRPGWKLEFGYVNCGSKQGGLLQGQVVVTYSKRLGGHERVGHFYSNSAGTCSLNSSLSAGHLSVHWGKALDINVKFVDPKALHGGGPPPAGCTGTTDASRKLTAAGTVRFSIHPSTLGSVKRRSVPVQAQSFGTADLCSAGNSSSGVISLGGLSKSQLASLQALFDSTSVEFGFGRPVDNPNVTFDGLDYAKHRQLDFDDNGGDRIAKHVSAEFDLELTGGKSLLSIARKLHSATVSVHAREVTGTLAFHALQSCPGWPDARNGTLTGAIIVTDPILGVVRFSAARATSAGVAGPNGIPGPCNGIGRLRMRVGSNCSKIADRCAISYNRNRVQFSDTSFDGTLHFSSERISFGDGSRSVKMQRGGVVTHTYKRPGRYRATLTAHTSSGIRRAHSTVYISAGSSWRALSGG